MTLTSIDPATGRPLRSYPGTTPEQVDAALEEAHRAWLAWRSLSFAERAVPMKRMAEILRERRQELALLMAEEMGKPVKQGAAEVEKCAWGCDHFAGEAARYLAPETIATDARKSYVAFQPLGAVLAVMPWNYPLWQVYRFAAPALMAGNVGILKHASNVPGCALAIEAMFVEAGFPEGAFRTLLLDSAEVKRVIEHGRIAAVTLTGSTPAGQAVAAQAGAVLKKAVLELGGSDAYVVLEDADLDLAARVCAAARLVNGGQSCIAAKRFVVAEPVLASFTERLVERMRGTRMGDPRKEDTELGPLARRDLRDALHRQVAASVERGARLLLGGEVPEGDGAYYPPTVLADVRPGMPAYDEELFGPAAAILPARDEAEAVRLANDSAFGLGGAVFTRDRERGESFALRLDAGSTFVNGQVASDPRLPFGGIKASGYGRELGSYGIKEFVNAKTVVLVT
jgi:succinate-semialdehyde dehydrogenase/glutarate-semialdehyde dehydrogenase